MKKKATNKPKVQSCPCACVPPPRKRRRAPTYTPRQQPQFYAALPMPQTQFDTDTIRRVVQDEFARYHTPRKTLSVAGVGVQTDFPDEDTVQLDDGVSSTTSGERRWDEQELGELPPLVGHGASLQESEMEELAARSEMEERLDLLLERLEAAKPTPFLPTPSMSQSEEEPRMTRGRYGLGERRREEMRDFLISQVEERNPGME